MPLSRPSNPAFAIILTLLLCISACEKKGSSTRDNSHVVNIHLEQSESYRQQGQYRAATIEARNALQKDESDVRGHIAIAKIYLDLGMSKRAMELLESLKSSESTERYQLLLAKAYLGRGKYRSALQSIKQYQADGTDTESQLLEATALGYLGQTDNASRLYRQILNGKPEELRAIVGLARLYAATGKMTEAETLSEQAQKVAPNVAETKILQAQIALKHDNADRAELLLTEAISSLPNTDSMTQFRSSVLTLLSEVLAKQGKTAEALVYSQMVSKAFPGFEVASGDYSNALEHYQSGELAEAEQLLDTLVEEYPEYEEANILLALVKYQQGDSRAAAQLFENNLDAETANPDLTRVAALANLQSSQPEKVVTLLEEEIDQVDAIELLNIYGVAAMSIGKWHSAETALKRSLMKESTQPAVSLLLGKLYDRSSSGPSTEALRVLQEGHNLNPGNAKLSAALVAQLVKHQRIDQANQLIEKRLVAFPDDIYSHILAADFYASQGNYQKAEQGYQQAINIGDKNLPVHIKLADNAMRTKDYERAFTRYQLATGLSQDNSTPYRGVISSSLAAGNVQRGLSTLENMTDNPAALFALTEYYASQSEFNAAGKYVNQLKTLSPDSMATKNAELLLVFAQLQKHMESENYDMARETAITGLSIDPGAETLLLTLAHIEIKTANYTEARKLIRQIEPQAPIEAKMLLAELQLARGNNEAAIESYQQAWQMKPSDQTGEQLYVTLRDMDERRAVEFLKEWLSTLPNSLPALNYQSSSLLAAENFQAAIPVLENIRAIYPSSASNLNNLAWSYQQENKPDAALSTAEQAVSLAPNVAAIMDTYGWILFLQGHRPAALDALQKAHQLDPDNREIEQHLQQARNAQ